MQTMTALLRVNGSRDMTVKLNLVTPAEAWLLMHIHDPDTKDVFEDAHLTGDVAVSKIDERTRLVAKYPAAEKLVMQLFPGRTAADIPDDFGELEGVPLEVAVEGARVLKAQATKAEVEDAPVGESEPFAAAAASPSKGQGKGQSLTQEQSRAAFGGRKR